VPHDRFNLAGVAIGDAVFVKVKEARVFVDDYII
jgi:hypothetical protein